MKDKIILILAVSLFVLSGCKIREGTTITEGTPTGKCMLMQNEDTEEYGCFGCSGIDGPFGGQAVCIDPIPSMKLVEQNSDRCEITSQGCILKE